MTVVCFGALRERLPDPSQSSTRVQLPGPASVSDVARHLGIPEGMVHLALVDGHRASASTQVTDGAEVTLMPAFSGGALD